MSTVQQIVIKFPKTVGSHMMVDLSRDFAIEEHGVMEEMAHYVQTRASWGTLDVLNKSAIEVARKSNNPKLAELEKQGRFIDGVLSLLDVKKTIFQERRAQDPSLLVTTSTYKEQVDSFIAEWL